LAIISGEEVGLVAKTRTFLGRVRRENFLKPAPIQTARLDNYPRPDFIRMDIEDGETAALHGWQSWAILARLQEMNKVQGAARTFIAVLFCANGASVAAQQSDVTEFTPSDELMTLDH